VPARQSTANATRRKAAHTAESRAFRILSFDGGGIRGIIPALWLERLEHHLGSPIADHVDLVAGTSTGAILAAAVGLRIPMSHVVALYRKRGKEIFPGGASQLWSRASRIFTQGASHPRYDGVGLANALRAELRLDGNPLPLFGDAATRLLITSYDTISREAMVMKSWDKRYETLPMWEVAKASSSAPTYFPAHVMEVNGAERALVDGGVVANNPAVAALATAVQLSSSESGAVLNPRALVLGSFGTGALARSISKGEAREWGALEWAIPIIDVLFDGTADAIDYYLTAVLPPTNYLRFQTPLRVGYDDMDNADATNLAGLTSIAVEYLERAQNGETGEARIARLAGMLRPE
jgi:hypothetical protein